MAKPKILYFTPSYSDRSGMDISYDKSTQTLRIGGWYDGCAGIESSEISLTKFLKGFGITIKDCEKALKEK